MSKHDTTNTAAPVAEPVVVAAPVVEPERDLFAEGQAIETMAGSGQLVTTVLDFDMTRLPELAKAIQAAVPGLDLNLKALKKCGKDKLGRKIVQYAVKRRIPTPVAVTVWANGTIVFAGMQAIKLPKLAA
jgi:hypothetical protein